MRSVFVVLLLTLLATNHAIPAEEKMKDQTESTTQPEFSVRYSKFLCSTEILKEMKPLMAIKKKLMVSKISPESLRERMAEMDRLWRKIETTFTPALEKFGLSKTDFEEVRRDDARLRLTAEAANEQCRKECRDVLAADDLADESPMLRLTAQEIIERLGAAPVRK